MVDPSSASHQGESPPQRSRAPTITIETAVSPAHPPYDGNAPLLQSSAPGSPQDESISPTTTVDPLARSWSGSGKTAINYRSDLQSFDHKDSRPTSPHNVSSPVTSRGNDRLHNFLAVPNVRSRQNSIDSDDGSHSITSSRGETVAVPNASRSEKESSSSEPINHKIMTDDTALRPDQGKEEDFQVEDNPFAFSPGQLSKLFNPKSLPAFYRLGGLEGLEKGLRTSRTSGLSAEEKRLDGNISFEEATGFSEAHVEANVVPLQAGQPTSHQHGSEDDYFQDRKRVFKDNRLPEKKGKSLLQLMWITYNDKVLILLSIAAVVSLAIGLYQTFGTEHDSQHPAVEWVEGVAIIVAIVIVVVVGSLNDYQKERQFAKLNKKKQDRDIKVVRSGKAIEISVFDVLVGDVLHLEPGDLIPADGVLIEGYNVKCDESQTTGESDIIRKRPADEVYHAIKNNDNLRKMDPFIQSGARVMEGVGTFMVTSTGVYSSHGKTLMSLNEDPEMTPLQSKLNVIAEYIAKLGGAAGLLLFLVLFIKFLAQLPHMEGTPAQKGQVFLNIFIVVVTIIVVAVPEGLPLAVTLALAFATTRMLKDNNLVRHLKACEIMGNATTICSDKTGTLTQNKMQVVAGVIGANHQFGTADQPSTAEENAPPTPPSDAPTAQEIVSLLGKDVKKLLVASIAINSTAFEGEVDGVQTFIGSKTETALLIFAKEHLAMGPVAEERSNVKILQLFPFDSGRKCMGVVVQLPDGRARMYVKGASEIMLSKCTKVLRDPTQDLSHAPLTNESRRTIGNSIERFASRSLRTIGIIYRDFDNWPPKGARRADGEMNEVVFEEVFRHMVFIGMVGIQDPLRDGVREAVELCQKAGVMVRMVTGDNRLTAEAISKECGIFQPNTIVMEGPDFRNLTKQQQEEILPRLHVLARSSPEDKRILVRRLKDKGEIVAVTGDGTNDAPALKMADVGFSMGVAGTEVAKEASAIILMDDNFISIVKALKWGRAVNDAVKRFLQFQLTVNVTAVVLTFVSAVSNDNEESVLTAVQLLWVNLIMDTLAALALATDPPQDSVLDRKPERKNVSIISTSMWKMILGQSIYQLVITFLLYFGSTNILSWDEDLTEQDQKDQLATLVFNTFVWMQIFNQWNNRRLDNNFNIFEGLTRNWFFICINLIMCGGQVLIILFGGDAFNIANNGQEGVQWAYAIVLGFISIPIGMIIRLIPDRLLERLVPESLKKKQENVPGFTVSDEDEWFNSHPFPLVEVRDELAFLKRVKGGRINNLKFAMKHPREAFMPKSWSPSHSRSNSVNRSIPQTPNREDSYGSVTPTPTLDSRKRSRSMRSRSNSALGAPTVMAGIIAAGVAAGWSPINQNSEFPARMTPHGSELGSSPILDEAGLVEEPASMEENGASSTSNSKAPEEKEVM